MAVWVTRDDDGGPVWMWKENPRKVNGVWQCATGTPLNHDAWVLLVGPVVPGSKFKIEVKKIDGTS